MKAIGIRSVLALSWCVIFPIGAQVLLRGTGQGNSKVSGSPLLQSHHHLSLSDDESSIHLTKPLQWHDTSLSELDDDDVVYDPSDDFESMESDLIMTRKLSSEDVLVNVSIAYIVNSSIEPTNAEIDTLINNTFDFYSQVYQESFEESLISVSPVGVITEDDLGLFILNFEASLTFSSAPPLAEEVATASADIDENEYLEFYVWPSGPNFSIIESVGIVANAEDAPVELGTASPTDPPIETMAPTVAETDAPTASPTVVTDEPTAAPSPLETDPPTVATEEPETTAPTASATNNPTNPSGETAVPTVAQTSPL